MKISNGIETQVRAGEFVYVVTIGTGTAVLDLSIDASGFQQITDFSYSADTNGVLTLPSGVIKATLGGDATLHISPLSK